MVDPSVTDFLKSPLTHPVHCSLQGSKLSIAEDLVTGITSHDCAEVMDLGHPLLTLRVMPSIDLSSQTYKQRFSRP